MRTLSCKINVCATIVVTALAAIGHTAEAQGFPFSQRATLSQNIAFTRIDIEYGRPVARGRELFGKLVPWDSVWHPGADSATRIKFSHDVIVQGKALAAGDYSLWLIPRGNRPWTLIFSRKAHVFHTPYPGSASDVLRIEILPETGFHMESLALYFPMVLRNDAIMRIHWGAVMLPVTIKAPYKPAG